MTNDGSLLQQSRWNATMMMCGSPPPSRKYATAHEEAPQTLTMVDEFRLGASDGSQPQSRMEMTDGERPAAMVTDGVEPAATSDEFRLRASDGSQPQSRMEMTDGERPAAMMTDGEEPAAMVTDREEPAAMSDQFRPRASDGSQPQSRMEMNFDATRIDGSLLQQSR